MRLRRRRSENRHHATTTEGDNRRSCAVGQRGVRSSGLSVANGRDRSIVAYA